MQASQLTAKQVRFVQEYLSDGDGAQAALRAGSLCAARVWLSWRLNNY